MAGLAKILAYLWDRQIMADKIHVAPVLDQQPNGEYQV
jgi:hypothetical protein